MSSDLHHKYPDIYGATHSETHHDYPDMYTTALNQYLEPTAEIKAPLLGNKEVTSLS